MLVGGQAARPHLGQQLGDGGIPGHVDPQHQGVDEETHQLIERGVAAPGDREPHRHIGTRADLGQQHRQRGLHHHEAGRVVLAGHLGNLLLQLGRPVHVHAWRRGDRPPADRADRWAAPGAPASRPALPPSRPAARRCGCGCRQITELRALPQRVVDVLHRQSAPSPGPAPRTGWHRPPPDHRPAG